MTVAWKQAIRAFRFRFLVAAIGMTAVGGFALVATRPVAVEIARPAHNVRAAVFGLGTIESRIQSKIGFDVSGILVELNADHGDYVRAGDVLARLRSSKQEARVAKARAGMLNAEAALERAEAAADRAKTQLAQRARINQRRQALLGRQFVSAEVAEQAQTDEDAAAVDIAVTAADVEIARAAVEDAKSQYAYERTLLDDHALRAPYDALVVARHKELGSALTSGEALFTLIDPKTVWILAYVDESRAGPLRVGQTANVRFRSLPGQIFAGRVTRIGLESDRVTEERRVYIACDNCSEDFHLGEQAEVEINIAALPSALLVPEAAITGFDGANGAVWTVEDGTLHRRTIAFRYRTLDARIEVVGGVPAGAGIVVEPKTGLRDGRAVMIKQGNAQ
jgi:HlyD family secretion protein